MVGILSWEQQDQTMAFNILNPDTFGGEPAPDHNSLQGPADFGRYAQDASNRLRPAVPN